MTRTDPSHYSRVAIIGDVHGDARKLEALVSGLHHDYPDAALFSVGDLIDRGPDSKRVVELCLEHDIRAVVGNHDEWVRTLLAKGTFSIVLLSEMWGARPVLRSYGCEANEPEEIAPAMLELLPKTHKAFFRELPYIRRLKVADGEIWITHSGIERCWLDGATEPDEVEAALLQLSDTQPALLSFGYPDLNDDDLWSPPSGFQVFGHQGVKVVIVRAGWAAIDTGCGSGGMLSAFVYPDLTVASAE